MVRSSGQHLSDYKNVRKNGLIAIGLDEGDEIAAVRLTNGSNRLVCCHPQRYGNSH
mgnify:CR=1 FL=1